jgi:hypothetical protein
MSPGDPPSVWCLVASVAPSANLASPDPESRFVARYFATGSRVYCVPIVWGRPSCRLRVLGHNRVDGRLVSLIVDARYLTSWRVRLATDPAFVSRLGKYWNGNQTARSWAETLARSFHDHDPNHDPDPQPLEPAGSVNAL